MSTGPDLQTVMLILVRHDYRCARCGEPIQGERGVDWSMQHRRPRGMGGSRWEYINSPANLIPVSGSGTTGCHGHMEKHRAEALTYGWLLPKSTVDPALHPVLVEHGSRWVYLDHYGGMSDDPVVAA